MLDNWQRIEKVVKWSNIPSINAFARELGLNRGENLYQIKRGNNGVSKELADAVSTRYPEISKAWLLTGEGDMLVENNALSTRYSAIPYFNIDAVSVVRSTTVMKPAYSIIIPDFCDCDFAALWFGDSMLPSIPNGSMVVCQKIEKEYIRPGDEYLVTSPSFDGIRRVRRQPNATSMRLEPRNRDEFDDVFLNLDDIESVYRIKGVIIKKN